MDTQILVIDVDASDPTVHQEFQGQSGSASIRLGIVNTCQVIFFQKRGHELEQTSFAARIPER